MALSAWLLDCFLIVLSFQTDCMMNIESVSSTSGFPQSPSSRDWFCSRCFQSPTHVPWTLQWAPANLQLLVSAFLGLKALLPSASVKESLLYEYMGGQSFKELSPLEIALKSMTLGSCCINTPTPSLLEMVVSHVFCTISQSFLMS